MQLKEIDLYIILKLKKMSKAKRYSILIFIFYFLACGEKTEIINKEVTIKGTNNKITIQVPKNCEQFSSNIRESIDFLKKSARKDLSLKKIYDKADLLGEFSERIQGITIAQCKINKNMNVYDPNFSDQVFYSELVKSYIEFQKWKDLKTYNTESTKLLDSAINKIYTNAYKNKKEELSSFINDMALSFSSQAGSTIIIFVNGQMACATIADIKGDVVCVIPKKYLLPVPNEITYIKIVATAIGFTPKELNYSLGETMLLASKGKRINLDD